MLFLFVFIHSLVGASVAKADIRRAALSVPAVCSSAESWRVPAMRRKVSFGSPEQLAVLCDALEELSKRYVMMSVKKFKPIFLANAEKCVSLVSPVPINSWKMGSLLKKCFAQYNDGHLKIDTLHTPSVFLPFKLKEVEGKFYISQRGYATCDDSTLEVGDEVLSIGGKKIFDIKKRLKDYVSSSTPQALSGLTDKFITDRNFALHDRGETEIVFVRKSKIYRTQITWAFKSHQVIEETLAILKKRGYIACGESSPLRLEGHFENSDLYPDVRSKSFFLDVEQKYRFLILSQPKLGEEKVCYLKLLSFNFKKVFHLSKEVDVWKILKFFIKTCSGNKRPIILDLRFNVGGDLNNMQSFVSLLITESSKKLLNQVPYLRVKDREDDDLECDARNGMTFNSSLNSEALGDILCLAFGVTSSVGGEGHDLFILTTEECMSACDYASLFLAQNQNSSLIGSPPQGAMLLTDRSDADLQKYKPYSFRIFNIAPFYIMKVQDFNEKDIRSFCNDSGDFCLKSLDGTLVLPDFPYTTNRTDMVSEPAGLGWRKKIKQVLSQRNLEPRL